MNGLPGLGLDFKSGGGGETNRAQEAQGVFLETFFWIADSAKEFGCEIGATTYVVDNFFREWILKEAVNGKVAALCVFSGEENSMDSGWRPFL